MHNLQKHDAAYPADKDILRGPPGLLFGLTLLIFVAARLCFGRDASPPSQDDIVSEQAAAVQTNADDVSPLLTRAYFINQ